MWTSQNEFNWTPFSRPRCGAGGDDENFPTSIELPNCNYIECTLRKDTPVNATIGFRTTHPAQKIQGIVHAFYLGRWINIKGGPEANVCDNLVKGKCPMKAGDEGTYRVSAKLPFFVPPNVRSLVRGRAVDEKNRTISCFHVRVHIQGWFWCFFKSIKIPKFRQFMNQVF